MALVDVESRSRKLAYLLRHDSECSYESGGWRLVSDLTDNHAFTNEEIEVIVSADAKGRFELNGDRTKVRALYGHSLSVDLSLSIDIPPEFLYHGTATKYISSIKNNGLLPRSRQYVHLTENIEMAEKIGLRHGKPVILKIFSHTMFSDDYIFHRLNNGVWLTPKVPQEYFEIIYQINSKK